MNEDDFTEGKEFENGNIYGLEDNPPNDRTPLYDGCHITLEESRLLIISFALRFSLSDKAIEQLLSLINCHLPVNQYGSFHIFKKDMPPGPLVKTNFYCSEVNCQRLVEFPEREDNVQCECGFHCNKKTLKKGGCYFLTLPLKNQLVSCLKDKRLFEKLRWEDDNESDVISGRFYKRCLNRIVSKGHDLTLQFNTDGVNVLKSSVMQMWPIQVSINELPFKYRTDNIILCGLWYGEGKPNMYVFLLPFIQELNELHLNGFLLPGETPGVVKVHTILCSVDSMARAPLQNLKTFRGSYGCSFCLHPGEEHEVGRGQTRLYRGDIHQLRSEQQHRDDVNEYLERHRPQNFHIHGIKGVSVLMILNVFNITTCFVPDYLHCVLLGVVKTMVTHWMAGANSEKDFYIGNDGKIDAIDNVLLNIKPPFEITRCPRSLHHWKLWKGHEWKNFLLYYSIPCLKAVNFPAKYLNHWFLLVFGITCFLTDKISDNQFEKGKAALRKYVLTLEEMYDTAELMKFNTHLLLHIPKSVKDFGMLWGSSTFSYEHYNGMLAKMFRSSQAVPIQICKNYVRLQGLKDELVHIAADINVPMCVKNLLSSLICGKATRHVFKFDRNLVLLGSPDIGQLTVIQQNVVETLINTRICNDHFNVQFYKRFILKGTLHHVEDYQRLIKRINSVVKLDNGDIISITHVIKVSTLEDDPRSLCVLLGFRLQPKGDLLCTDRDLKISTSSFLTVVEKTNECVAVFPNTIQRKCLLTFYPGEPLKYCCFPLVNLLERD